MSTTSLVQTLSQARKLVDNSENNLARLKDPHAHAVDSVMSSSHVGGALRTTVNFVRRDDPIVSRMRAEQISRTSYFESISTSLNELQQVLAGGSSAQESIIVTKLNELLNQTTILPGNKDLSMKQAFVDKAQSLTTALNQATTKARFLRLSADRDFSNDLNSLNMAVRGLFKLNQQILRSGPDAVKLYDDRDKFIEEISRYMNIKVNYGYNGVALLANTDGTVSLISQSSFGEFDYKGFASEEDIINRSEPNTVTMSQRTLDGNISTKLDVIKFGEAAFNKLNGGRLEGLAKVRDEILLDSYGAIQALTKGIVDALNTVHNDGSPWPPKTSFTSDIEYYTSHVLDLEGELEIHAVDKDGRQLKMGSYGVINAAKIDFSTFKGSSGSGKPTVGDVVKEFNQLMDTGPTRERAALGEICADYEGFGTSIVPDQYLLNNIQLVGTKDIENDQFSFDFELNGNSYFGSKVEILSVTGPAGALDSALLPDSFRLEKDMHTKTGNEITLDGFTSPGPHNVDITVRVIGDNGVVRHGTVRFSVDTSDSDMLNKRVAFDSSIVQPAAGDFKNPATNSTGIARARLIDENGYEVDPDSGRPATLVIETNSDDYRIVMQGSNFSRLFSLNDFIKRDELSGLVEVRPDIVFDVGQLSTGKVTATLGVEQRTAIGGDNAASVTFFLQSGLAIPNNPGAGDTITIDGEVFTFVAGAPANENEVQIDASIPNTLQNFIDAINNHTVLSGKFNATSDGTSSIVITASSTGTWANTVAVSADFSISGAGSTVGIDINSVAATVSGTLSGGSDKERIIQKNVYAVGDKSSEVWEAFNELKTKLIEFEGGGIVPDSLTSVHDYASLVSSLLSNQVNDAEADAEVSTRVLERIDDQFKGDFGINREEQYQNAMDAMQFLRMLSSLVRENNRLQQELLKMFD